MGGPAAYYKNVGIPLLIAAQMLATGDCEVGRRIEFNGLRPPEAAKPSDYEVEAPLGLVVSPWGPSIS
jgi:hypothetical protein